MSGSKPFSVRATTEQHARWKVRAVEGGTSLNKWILRALDDQAALEEAEKSEREEVIAERERVQKVAFPLGPNKCRHVTVGQYCYRCNRKRWE